jgi:phage gp29-like protein
MGRPNKLLDKLIASNVARARKDIKSWRTAMQVAETIDNPRRILLYNLYDELILDARVTTEIQKRILAVKGHPFNLVDKDGKANADLTNLFKQPWFYQFIEHAMNALFYGHSLIQISEIADGLIKKIELVNRRHVIPERGLFVFKQDDDKGISYRTDKQYAGWLIEVGAPKDLGLLSKAAPHVLYKRFTQSAWSEFTEIFGMPLRYGKTNVKDPESLNHMENMMINMGVASYAVIDNDEEITFVESARTDGAVYSNLINMCNAEISQLINGAVVGDASQGGSLAKEQVGERIGLSITDADIQFIESYINSELFPKLLSIGYPIADISISFEQSKSLSEIWTITQGLLNYYEVDEDFITQTFGVPVTEKRQSPAPNLNASTGFFASAPKNWGRK